MTLATYCWKIDDPDIVNKFKTAKPTNSFSSPIIGKHNLRWYIEIYPNGLSSQQKGELHYYVEMTSFVPTSLRIATEITFCLLEANIVQTHKCIFNEGTINHGWLNGSFPSNIIQSLNQFTFQIQLSLIQITAENGGDVTAKYVDITNEKVKLINIELVNQIFSENKLIDTKLEKIERKDNSDEVIHNYPTLGRVDNIYEQKQKQIQNKTVEARLDGLECCMDMLSEKMNRMEKDYKNRLDDILTDLNMIKTELKSKCVNKKHEELMLWLQNDVELPQYSNILIQNGYDSLSNVKLLNKERLKSIGIDKVGHIIRLVHQIDILQ